jgi:hypothetical protein
MASISTYITNFSVSGIKNLKEKVSLQFYKKTLDKKINLQNTNIKAIYGCNGAGKSAIIHALKIYTDIIKNKEFLYKNETTIRLNELINKETKKLVLDVNFLVYDKQTLEIKGNFLHEISIYEEGGSYYVDDEILRKINSQSETLIFWSQRGRIIQSSFTDELNERTKNILIKRSVVDIFLNELENVKLIDDKDVFEKIFYFYANALNILIMTDEEDDHLYYIMNVIENRKKSDFRLLNTNVGKSQGFNPEAIKPSSITSYRVRYEDFEDFSEFLLDLEKFIKIFKKNLVRIIPDKKDNGDHFIVEPYFDYGNYRIHLEFESAGIKKLVNVYQILKAKQQGMIIAIDEFDSKINDVYLTVLLEYFVDNPKGQLLFTTHNTSPMEILRKCNHSIDFLSEKGKVTSWVKNGNYVPANLYKKGFIDGLPFNIFSFDFNDVLDEN